MWPILISTGIAPPAIIKSAADDDLMIEHAGVGFTDIGCGTPGTDRYEPYNVGPSEDLSIASALSSRLRISRRSGQRVS